VCACSCVCLCAAAAAEGEVLCDRACACVYGCILVEVVGHLT